LHRNNPGVLSIGFGAKQKLIKKTIVRFTLILFLGLLNCLTAGAMCWSWGFHVWPQNRSISKNTIIVLEGYASSRSVIEDLGETNKAYLISQSERVDLKVVRILIGQYNATQAILKPVRELKVHETYQLHIDSLDLFNKQEFKEYKWTVDSTADLAAPVWSCDPVYKSKSVYSFGCGPAEYVTFCGFVEDASPTLIYTKVMNRSDYTSSDYFIEHSNHNISLGHAMCSGAFNFEKGKRYSVQFGLLDASGNETTILTEPLDFMAPTEENASVEIEVCRCEQKSKAWMYGVAFAGIAGLGGMFYMKRRKSPAKGN
jgi:hypothetical protein